MSKKIESSGSAEVVLDVDLRSLRAKVLAILLEAFGEDRSRAAATIKIPSSSFTKLDPVNEYSFETIALRNLVKRCLDYHETQKDVFTERQADELAQVLAGLDIGAREKKNLTTGVSREWAHQVEEGLAAIAKKSFSEISSLLLLPLQNEKRLYRRVVDGNYLLQCASAHSSFEQLNLYELLKEAERIVNDTMEELSNSSREENLVSIGSILQGFCGAATGKTPQGPAANWLKEQLGSYSRLVSGRHRLKNLDWPTPYKQDWAIEGSVKFNDIFCGGHEYLDGAAYIACRSKTQEPSNNRDANVNPGSPRHGFFRPSAFLFDCQPSALNTLLTRYSTRLETRLHEGTSPRLADAVPRLLSGCVKQGILRANPNVATCDVAPTVQNRLITIRQQTLANCLVGSAGVGLDGYTSAGAWDYDGLGHVAEDGRWMLLRTNHTSKAIRIAIQCVTSDSRVCFRLSAPSLVHDTPSWYPTFVEYALPVDFRAEKEHLSDAIRRACYRIISKRVSGVDIERCHLVGFALDASAGLQPHYFCMARLDQTEADLRNELNHLALRFHPLVEDNPSLSLGEAFSLGRYAESDLLRASLFADWRWCLDLADEKEATPITVLDSQEWTERILSGSGDKENRYAVT